MKEFARKVFQILDEAGATGALYVGGYVRDQILGVESKDVDIEVYGLSYARIEQALSAKFHTHLVGKSFGLATVTDERGNSIDVSVPRRESKVGVGHKGFETEFDPTMRPVDAARRRDYTMNSLAMTRDGNVLDFFGGVQDANDRILRATSERFADDPLRVLRGVQFASRFGLTMDDPTARECRRIRSEYSSLSDQRIWGEWVKWAKGEKPSFGLRVLQQTEWLELYPELSALVGLKQDPRHHPEGDVWEHTLYVVDEAARIASKRELNVEQTIAVVLAALLHDVGKAETTAERDGRIVSPGHAQAGEPLARQFMARLGTRIGSLERITKLVVPLTVEHMAHISGGKEPSNRAVRRLALRLHPATMPLWAAVVEADHSGRPPYPKANPVERWEQAAERLDVSDDKPAPILMGRHLLELGVEPGPEMGAILRTAFERQLDGEFTDLNGALEWARTEV